MTLNYPIPHIPVNQKSKLKTKERIHFLDVETWKIFDPDSKTSVNLLAPPQFQGRYLEAPSKTLFEN